LATRYYFGHRFVTLRYLGGDLGGAIKGFKGAMKDGEKNTEKESDDQKSVQDDSDSSDKKD